MVVVTWALLPDRLHAQADDVADVLSEDRHAAGDEKKRYFLIGPRQEGEPPPAGYGLVVVMPGGAGNAEFHAFVKRIFKNALPEGYLVAQPVAVKWTESQQVVWPTTKLPADKMQFTTEDFVSAVIGDVETKHKLDPRRVFTLSWSSSGTAAYAISLTNKKVAGSLIAMSVYRPDWLPPLESAKGRGYFLYHSPDDRVCPFGMAEQAVKDLEKVKANVKLATYTGGHGWRGPLYRDIRTGIEWLEKNNAAVSVADEQRSQIRRALFIPDPLPPLEARTHGQFEPEPGIIAERVSYATQFGLRIPAILYRPNVRRTAFRRNSRQPASHASQSLAGARGAGVFFGPSDVLFASTASFGLGKTHDPFAQVASLAEPLAIAPPEGGTTNKIPALVVVNGHGGDKFSWYAFYTGILYARAGAAVLTYDPVGEGERHRERRSGTRAHDQKQEPREMGQRMGGQLVTDVMQAVSYLQSRPEIDPSRIGAMGYSLGSFLTSVAGAADPRLKVCVLAGGGNLDGPDGYWDRSKPMCQAIPYQSLGFLGDRPAALYALHAARGPTLIINGSADSVVGIPGHKHDAAFFRELQDRAAKRLRELRQAFPAEVAATNGSRSVFDFEMVPDISHRPFFVTRPVALWLEQHLDLPNWTAETIRALPETHIAPWATANHVEMDRLYVTENREGGTRALGEKVPGLSRTLLSVFPDDEWNREKERLIYESWVEAARARLGKAP